MDKFKELSKFFPVLQSFSENLFTREDFGKEHAGKIKFTSFFKKNIF